MIIEVKTWNLCRILDLQKVNIKTCSYIKACNDNQMKSSPQRLWIYVDMRWSEEQSDVDTPFSPSYSCYWSPGPGQNIPPKHCQTLHLSNILTGIYLVETGRLTFKSLFQSLQKSKATLSQTCAVEFGWTKSSDIFNWLLLKNCFIMHSTLKILLLNMWNINYQPCGTPNKWSTNY